MDRKSGRPPQLRILQICKKFPFPLKDGESIAVSYMSRALCELGCELTLLSMNTSKHYIDIPAIAADLDHYKAVHTINYDNHLNPLDALLNLFSNASFHITRYISKEFEEKLAEILDQQTFDIIQLETLYLVPYIPVIRRLSNAKIVLRAHNVEFEIWERITANTNNIIKKVYLSILTKKLRNFEIKELNSWDYCLAITERDLQKYKQLGMLKPSMVAPIGLDISDYMASSECFKKPLEVSFIGSLDWRPNVEAIHWFMSQIWHFAKQEVADLKFHIAGRNTPKEITAYHDGEVIVHGDVESATEFINNYPLMIVPILSAGGMRAKILEGMALGKVVLTTSIGLEGINGKDFEHVLIANSPEEFVEKLVWANSNVDELLAIGQRAQVFVAKNFDNYRIAEQIMQQYFQLLKIEKIISRELIS